MRIGTLAVDNGRIGIEDRSRAQPFTATLAPIRFTLTDFRTDLNYENAYRFSGATPAGEQLPVKLASDTASLSGGYRVALDPELALDTHYRRLPCAISRSVNAASGRHLR